jgi:hypothetical protein
MPKFARERHLKAYLFPALRLRIERLQCGPLIT